MRRPMKAIPGELEALLKAAKSIGLLSNMQASSMRNDVQTGRLTAGVVTAQLKKRREEQTQLGAAIDRLMVQAGTDDGAPRGCFSSLVHIFFRRRRGNSVSPAALATGDAGLAPAGASSVHGSAVHRAVFGLAGSKKAADASTKLEEALGAMRVRVD